MYQGGTGELNEKSVFSARRPRSMVSFRRDWH
jgi:hypothetical protein